MLLSKAPNPYPLGKFPTSVFASTQPHPYVPEQLHPLQPKFEESVISHSPSSSHSASPSLSDYPVSRTGEYTSAPAYSAGPSTYPHSFKHPQYNHQSLPYPVHPPKPTPLPYPPYHPQSYELSGSESTPALEVFPPAEPSFPQYSDQPGFYAQPAPLLAYAPPSQHPMSSLRRQPSNEHPGSYPARSHPPATTLSNTATHSYSPLEHSHPPGLSGYAPSPFSHDTWKPYRSDSSFSRTLPSFPLFAPPALNVGSSTGALGALRSLSDHPTYDPLSLHHTQLPYATSHQPSMQSQLQPDYPPPRHLQPHYNLPLQSSSPYPRNYLPPISDAHLCPANPVNSDPSQPNPSSYPS